MNQKTKQTLSRQSKMWITPLVAVGTIVFNVAYTTGSNEVRLAHITEKIKINTSAITKQEAKNNIDHDLLIKVQRDIQWIRQTLEHPDPRSR